MNISTYEARIAALESQIGPGPVTGEGILSAAITPAIGNSEATLSTALPYYYAEGETNTKIVNITVPKVISSAFTVSITPTSTYYAGFIHGVEGTPVLAGKPGETLTVDVTEDYDANLYLLGVIDPSDQSSSFVQIEVHFNII